MIKSNVHFQIRRLIQPQKGNQTIQLSSSLAPGQDCGKFCLIPTAFPLSADKEPGSSLPATSIQGITPQATAEVHSDF